MNILANHRAEKLFLKVLKVNSTSTNHSAINNTEKDLKLRGKDCNMSNTCAKLRNIFQIITLTTP